MEQLKKEIRAVISVTNAEVSNNAYEITFRKTLKSMLRFSNEPGIRQRNVVIKF